jgi:hypothetical protein
MDATLIAYLVGLATITITPLAGFGTKLLLKKIEETSQKAELTKLGLKGDSLAVGQKNAKIAILATQQAFRNKSTTTNEEKKYFGMDMLRQLNIEAGINMAEETMSALIEAGVWEKNNPIPAEPVAQPIVSPVVTPSPISSDSMPQEGLIK